MPIVYQKTSRSIWNGLAKKLKISIQIG